MNSTVGEAIALVDNTDVFTLSGTIGSRPVATAAVDLTVLTNSLSGYQVSVAPVTPTSATAPTVPAAAPLTFATDLISLTADPVNLATIPVGDISVQETPLTPADNGSTQAPATYTPLSGTGPVTVYSQNGPSASAGDTLTNDYQYSTPIPAVAPDTYTVQLDYVALVGQP